MSQPRLDRTLGLFPATAIVVGSVVGSGIFVSSAAMARGLGSAPLFLVVWLAAGIITLFGALSQCELAAQMPRTGGLYEYFHRIYGPKTGFLYGWSNFTVTGSGAIAALAYIFASYLGELVSLPRLEPRLDTWPVHLPCLGTIFPLANFGAKLAASGLVIFLTALNMRGIRLGARVQSISTSAKVLAILGIAAVALIGGAKLGHVSNLWQTSKLLADNHVPIFSRIGSIGLAMSSAFWAYDGWGTLSDISGEVRQPEKNVPRAILLGTATFIALYLLINISYLFILPIDKLGAVSGDRVASTVVSAVVGPVGGAMLAVLVVLSVFDTTNAVILTNARIYFAMARRNLFWARAGVPHPRYHSPHVALACQGSWALVLLISGSFELLVGMYIFVNWAFYVLMVSGVFVLRLRSPSAPRPFKTPGYPWVPLVFLVFSLAFVIVTFVSDFQAFRAGQAEVIRSLMGIVLVAAGLPFYFLWRENSLFRKQARAP